MQIINVIRPTGRYRYYMVNFKVLYFEVRPAPVAVPTLLAVQGSLVRAVWWQFSNVGPLGDVRAMSDVAEQPLPLLDTSDNQVSRFLGYVDPDPFSL